MREVAADADPLGQGFACSPRWTRLGVAESQPLMNKITNGPNAGPPAVDGAEVRPSEIGEKLGLAISARSKLLQRIERKVWRGDRVGGGVDLILLSVAAKDALTAQRDCPGRRGHPPQSRRPRAVFQDRG